MASLINFSGLASGIDSNALIKAMLDSERKVRVDPFQAQITRLTDTDTALDSIKQKLTALNSAVAKFRLVNGGALSKNATSSDETSVTASASNGASNATYAVSVGQLARAATFSFDDRFTSDSQVINSSINNGAAAANRTVTLTIGTGAEQETVDIELTNTTTASQFVSQVNAGTTQAQASLVNVGTSASPSYAVVINSLNQGTEQGQLTVNVGSEITSAGAGAFGASSLTQAEDAEFTVSGISGTITRSTNTVSDVLTNVTLNLTGLGSATVSVSDDPTTSAQTVQDFVDAYNDLRDFINSKDTVTQSEDSSGTTNIFGPLAQTSLDENLISTLRSALSSATSSSGSLHSLADLGITTERDGSLKFDSTVFKDALASDPAASATILQNLGETLGAVDGTIAQFNRFGGLIDTEENNNKSQIDSLTKRIADVEKVLSREEEGLTARFARLESLMGKLNSQQSSLAGILGTS